MPLRGRRWIWIGGSGCRHARQNRAGRFWIHDADRRNRRGTRKVDIDDLAGALPGRRSRRSSRSLRGLRQRDFGRAPGRRIMLEIAFKRGCGQIGAHPIGVAEQRKRLAILRGAAVADREHISDKTEAVGFKRAAQRRHHGLELDALALAEGRHVREQRQLRADIGGRRSNSRRRCKQRFLAGRLDTLADQSIETRKRRTGNENL